MIWHGCIPNAELPSRVDKKVACGQRGDIDILAGRTTNFQECKLVAHSSPTFSDKVFRIFLFFQSCASIVPVDLYLLIYLLDQPSK